MERCFRTLLERTDYPHFQLALIDNGSEDGSAAWVKQRFPGVDVQRIFPNAGYAHAANEAVQLAASRGAKYVAVMNDDIAILHSQWLSAAIAHAERDPQLGIISFVESMSEDPRDSTPYATLTEVDYLRGFGMVIPVDLFNSIGLFDEVYFVVGDEDDLGARAQAAGYRLAKLGIPIFHVGGGTNHVYSLRTAYMQMRNGIRFCIKNRSLSKAAMRTLRILDVACSPFPLTFDADDAAHCRMRNSGNVLCNTWLWLRAIAWNIVRLPQTLSIRAAERRRCSATLSGERGAAQSS